MKDIRISSNRTKIWAAFVCLSMASFLMHGCAGAGTPNSADSGKGGGKGGGRGKGKGGDAGPVPVVVAKVSQKDVPVEVSVVGNVEAYATITVIPQVGGALTEVLFHEGDYVKKGQTLFVVDPRPFEAALAQSQANLMKDKAGLGQAEANLARDIASEKIRPR